MTLQTQTNFVKPKYIENITGLYDLETYLETSCCQKLSKFASAAWSYSAPMFRRVLRHAQP